MSRFMLSSIAIGIAIILLGSGEKAFAEKRIALVIGNSSYEKLAPLDNPKNDAKLVADTLVDLGFSLIGKSAQLNLDKVSFDKAVQKFGMELQDADVGLFYYAGHGVEVKGINYLVPVGANPVREADVDFELISANLILRQMEAAQTKLNLVILDACRNNPLAGRGIRAGGGGLVALQSAPGTLISYSTQPGNVALDGTDGNSPYTTALAKTMRKPGLRIFDVFNEVGLLVLISSNGAQQPWQSSSPIKADFYFSGQTVSSLAAPAPPVILPAPAPQKSTAPVIPPKTAAIVAPPTPSASESRNCSNDGEYIVTNVAFSDPVGGLVVRSAARAIELPIFVTPPSRRQPLEFRQYQVTTAYAS